MDLNQPVRNWLPVMIYPGYAPDLPDLVVGILPTVMVPPGRPGGNIKVWIVESPEENDALQAALDRPISLRNGYLDFKESLDCHVNASSRYARNIAMVYVPPFDDWPWIVLFRWPEAIGRDVQAQRGRYTYEIFYSEGEARTYFQTAMKNPGAAVLQPVKQRFDR